MKVSKSSGGGAWLDKKKLQNGDMIKILTDAVEVENQQGGTQLVAKVKVKGMDGDFNCGINGASKNAFIEAYGDDTADWVDKVVTVNVEKTVVAGKRGIALYLIPGGFEVSEDRAGYVQITPIGSANAKKDDTEESQEEYSGPDINPDDIPF